VSREHDTYPNTSYNIIYTPCITQGAAQVSSSDTCLKAPSREKNRVNRCHNYCHNYCSKHQVKQRIWSNGGSWSWILVPENVGCLGVGFDCLLEYTCSNCGLSSIAREDKSMSSSDPRLSRTWLLYGERGERGCYCRMVIDTTIHLV
jgi:hypothetical protein